MADLKPIGSEKLEGTDKLKRIMEIANYGRTSSQEINESTGSVDYTIQLADGNFYGIVKEKNGYIVKKGINESELEYSEPMKNRKYYSSYSQAMKKVNLIASELNRLHENEEGISLIGEQKKFVLKTPKAEPEAPETPEAEPTMDMADEPEMEVDDMEMDLDGEEMSMDDEEFEMGDEEMDMEDDEKSEEDEDLSFKTIQKLTGKLGQKLRTIESRQGLSSEDIKYVVNSVLSAVDLTKLTEEDYEDVMEHFEEVEGEVDDNEETIDMDMEMSDEEEGGEEELDLDLDMEVEPEMGEGMKSVEKTMDEIFTESKVEKVLSKYFVITEDEKKVMKEKETKKYLVEKAKASLVKKEIKKLSETVEQELTSNVLMKEGKNVKFLGKTNKNNLLFEMEGKKVKISTKGEII